MLEAVGHGTVVNPDRALRVMASERGWDMARFQNPVTLRASLAEHVSHIPGHVASIPGHVANIPGHVAHIPAHVANIPDHVASIPGKVSTIPDAVKAKLPDKKMAAIAAGAAGAAAAGLAIAHTIRKGSAAGAAKVKAKGDPTGAIPVVTGAIPIITGAIPTVKKPVSGKDSEAANTGTKGKR